MGLLNRQRIGMVKSQFMFMIYKRKAVNWQKITPRKKNRKKREKERKIL